MDERGGSVLVADDDQRLADLYAEILETDYQVEVVYGGTAVLDRLDGGIDVIVLDRRMPDRSGDDVVEAIRERGLANPVVMVTAVEPDVDIVDLPFDEYLVKPVQPAELTDAVDRLVTLADHYGGIREYYSLLDKVLALQDRRDRQRIADRREYTALMQRLREVRDQIDAANTPRDGRLALELQEKWSGSSVDPELLFEA